MEVSATPHFAPPAKGSGLGTARLWYAAIVPLLGVYVEIYADSFKLGLLVWITALIMSPAACLLDLMYIKKNGWASERLKPVHALLPPVYIFKRTRLTGDSSVCGAVWCIMAVYALIFNNFTTSATLKKSDLTGYIKYSSWSSISGLSDVSCDRTIEDALSGLAGGDGDESSLTWDAEKHSGYITVTCGAKNGSINAKFEIDFDGYCTGESRIVSFTENGKEYKGGDAEERIKELFPNEDSSEDPGTDSGDTADNDNTEGE